MISVICELEEWLRSLDGGHGQMLQYRNVLICELEEWLRSLDGGHGQMLLDQYRNVLIKEFDGDFKQIACCYQSQKAERSARLIQTFGMR